MVGRYVKVSLFFWAVVVRGRWNLRPRVSRYNKLQAWNALTMTSFASLVSRLRERQRCRQSNSAFTALLAASASHLVACALVLLGLFVVVVGFWCWLCVHRITCCALSAVRLLGSPAAPPPLHHTRTHCQTLNLYSQCKLIAQTERQTFGIIDVLNISWIYRNIYL